MKVSPVGAGFGAIAQAAPVESQVAKAQDIRKLKMSTNAYPERFEQESLETAPESVNPDTNGQTIAAEDTKPLSPQFAALAKQRRALQVKERELLDKEKQLATHHSSGVAIDRIKSEPLSVLREAGVSYDDLTAAILADQGSPELRALQAEVKALKEGVDQKFTEKDTQAEQQVLAEMRREALALASQGEKFELIRETKSVPDVMKLIERIYRERGEVLDVTVAMQLIESELENDALRLANLSKVQSRLTPPPQQTQTRPMSTMRTLTNRDTARSVMSAKARAIAAFNGTLKK